MPPAPQKACARAGVDIDLGTRLKGGVGRQLKSTHGPEVLGKAGGFGGPARRGLPTAVSQTRLSTLACGLARKRLDSRDRHQPPPVHWHGEPVPKPFAVRENDLLYRVDFQGGYSQGIFLDFGAQAAPLLAPGGVMRCSSNARTLTAPGFRRMILGSLPGDANRWQMDPAPMPADFTGEHSLQAWWVRLPPI